tara:strand:+ start:63024 stop:63356 length:333 start_codon:yes stop_codon:yes gene_type:complete
MRITESRLRKTIRQVIRESARDLSRRDLYKELAQLGHGVSPDEERVLEDHCGGIDYKFGLEYGTVYNAVHDASEAISPGSRDSDLLVMQNLQSDQKYDIIHLTVEILIHE